MSDPNLRLQWAAFNPARPTRSTRSARFPSAMSWKARLSMLARTGRDETLAGNFVGGQHVGMIVGVKPAAMTSAPFSNRSGSANSLTFGFKKPLNSPALRMTWRRDAALHPALISLDEAVAQHRLHAGARLVSRACLSASRLPNRLSLSLQNPTLGIAGARSMSSRLADRLVQHDGHGRYVRDRRVGVPVVGMARLLEQLDAGRIERGGESAGLVRA